MKTFSLAVGMAALLALAACGDDAADTDTSTGTGTTPPAATEPATPPAGGGGSTPPAGG